MVTLEVAPNAGLCVDCNNSQDCPYRAQEGPVHFCELFDDFTPPEWEPDEEDAGQTATSLRCAHPAMEESLEVVGLCVNCENRQTCTHLKPEGGIWHCEDYQ